MSYIPKQVMLNLSRCFSHAMPRPILYTADLSPGCRAVLLVAKVINLDLEYRQVNLAKREHLKEDFIKINPQHTIPVLNDNGDIFWDSHAINCYLVGKYAKDDSLYPKDLKERAIIDQRLHFDSGVLFSLLRDIIVPFFARNHLEITKDQRFKAKEAYGFLDKFLENQKWLTAGDNYTLADISCVSTIGSLNTFIPIDKYPNVVRWMKTCENELPGYVKINEPVEKINSAIRAKLQSNL